MSKRIKVDAAVKSEILKLQKENLTIEPIGKRGKRSKSVASRFLKLYNETGRLTNTKKSGNQEKPDNS